MNNQKSVSNKVLMKLQSLMAANDYLSAYELVAKQLISYPKSGDLHFFSLNICFTLAKLEEALIHAQFLFDVVRKEVNYKNVYYELLSQLHAKQQFKLMERASLWLVQHDAKNGLGWNYLGISFIEQARFLESKECLLNAVKRLPNNQHILTNLGNTLIALGEYGHALPYLERAVVVDPNLSEAWNNLGNVYRYSGRVLDAINAYQNGLKIAPNFAELYTNLGVAYNQNNKYLEAITCFDKALELDQTLLPVYANKIDALRQMGKLKDALTLSEACLRTYPDIQEVWAVYGNCLRDASRVDEAIEALIKAQSYKNERSIHVNKAIYTSLLFCLNYHPDLDGATIYSAYQDFNQKFCIPLQSTWRSHTNTKLVNRKLKIGYVSQSFYSHVCKHFLLPLIENHNRDEFEIFAYANCVKVDSYTQKYMQAVDHWIDTTAMTDEEMAEKIRFDAIDILIDIAGHTNDNRLLVMARKPAPVSAHWLDFGYTTGLTAIDYYITDQVGLTAGAEKLFSEKPWALDGPYIAYRPLDFAANTVINELPAIKNGFITFGCLSRSIRINHKVIKVWSAMLDAMPTSRLIIDSPDFADEEVCEEMRNKFAALGVDKQRLTIGFHRPSWDVLSHFDISLDCFPHNSGMTLVESLYMGVPFITLAGRPSIGRLGASILMAADCGEWIAETEEEYARKAIILAHDIDALAEIRQNLREKTQASLLMNEVNFAQSMERSYRQMWQKYCEENPS